MTTDSEIRKLCEEVEEYCSKASDGPWQHFILTNEGGKNWESAEEISQYVLRCLKAGANLDFYAVQCVKPDGEADVCHVGNGPTSPQNCYFIARARTDLPKLSALLRERMEEERWIPVSERLPELGEQVMLWACHGWATAGTRRTTFDGWEFQNHADFPTECFTHWKSISAPEVKG